MTSENVIVLKEPTSDKDRIEVVVRFVVKRDYYKFWCRGTSPFEWIKDLVERGKHDQGREIGD